MNSSASTQNDISRRRMLAQITRACLGVRVIPAGLSASALAAGETRAKLVCGIRKRAASPAPPKKIRTSADGVFLSEHLPLTAKQMHHGAVIRSLASTQGAHAQGYYFMHTSYALRGTIKHPSLGAWLAQFPGAGNPSLPSSVYIGNASGHPGEGFLPPQISPFLVSNPENGLQNIRPQDGLTVDMLNARLRFAQQFGNGFRAASPHRGMKAQAEMYDGAIRRIRSADLVAFYLSLEEASLRSAYGAGAFGQGCLLARRLVQPGVRFVEVGLNGWDTHINNFTSMPELCRQLDRGLATLLSDLSSRGMLQETLVVVATEFGRTPRININQGRDQYPQAFSAAMFGGGIKGRFAFGATDPTGTEVIDKKVSVPDLNATIARALGLLLDQKILSPSGRPFSVADKGKPLEELFA